MYQCASPFVYQIVRHFMCIFTALDPFFTGSSFVEYGIWIHQWVTV